MAWGGAVFDMPFLLIIFLLKRLKKVNNLQFILQACISSKNKSFIFTNVGTHDKKNWSYSKGCSLIDFINTSEERTVYVFRVKQ
jgi:hypothetical protein